jgi:uncharacterized protein (DUF433 family)
MTELEDRIEVDPDVKAGKPVVKGTRIPVFIVLDMFGDGMGAEDVLEAYPDLELEDVKGCLQYASKRVQRDDTVYESVA